MDFGLVATDTRFLSVHPRTLLWWQEREQCKRCAHYREKTVSYGRYRPSLLQICVAEPRRRAYPWACVEMREEGAPCGPNGVLFRPRECGVEVE